MPTIRFLNLCQTSCWRSFLRFSVCKIINYRSCFIEMEGQTVYFSTFCTCFITCSISRHLPWGAHGCWADGEDRSALQHLTQTDKSDLQTGSHWHPRTGQWRGEVKFFFLLAATSKPHRFPPASTSTLLFTDDSELPGWSMFCIGHNERYSSAALINDDDLSVSIFNTELWWTQSWQVYL